MKMADGSLEQCRRRSIHHIGWMCSQVGFLSIHVGGQWAGVLARPVRMTTAFTHAIWAFFKQFILQREFLDGWAGFVIAFGHSEGAFYRYAKRVEADSRWQLPPSLPLTRPKP